MLIGITGTIGSGKSYVSNIIHNSYHYDVFSSDVFVNMAYADNKVKEQLNNYFNCLVDGKVDKSIIKEKLNDDSINVLNQIIHPFVIDKIKKLKKDYVDKIAFVEVPLLYELNLDYLFDKVIAISIDDDLRHQRLKERDKNNYQKMLFLEKKQFDNNQKCLKADYIIYGSLNDDNTKRQISDIINKIN